MLPLTTISAESRQIAVESLSPVARLFFDFAFPGFLDRPQDVRPLRPPTDDPDLAAYVEAMQEKVVISKNRRRFAGDILAHVGARDSDLPRRRYHALIGPDGTDRGLLRAELQAYAEMRETGFFLLADGLLEQDLRHVPLERPEECIIGGLLPGSKAQRAFARLAEAALSPAEAQQAARPETMLFVRMNTRRQPLTVDGVLDLRRPYARERFFQMFERGVEGFPGYGEPAPGGRFEGMLPTLMSQVRGGSLAGQAIGAALRRMGVGGLVFPSARLDPMVKVEHGVVTDWRGWNFVHYEDAPRALTPAEARVHFFSEREFAAGAPALAGLGPGDTAVLVMDPLWNPPQTPVFDIAIGEGADRGSFEVDGHEARLDAERYAVYEAERAAAG